MFNHPLVLDDEAVKKHCVGRIAHLLGAEDMHMVNQAFKGYKIHKNHSDPMQLFTDLTKFLYLA